MQNPDGLVELLLRRRASGKSTSLTLCCRRRFVADICAGVCQTQKRHKTGREDCDGDTIPLHGPSPYGRFETSTTAEVVKQRALDYF
jgi:hypothetical protein